MNVHTKSMMRCARFQSNKKLPLNVEEGAENATITANSRIDKKNESSPKSCRASSNHSTPIRQKPGSDNPEDLPNLDYSPTPSLLPATQDGNNEIAWDWQNTLNKTPNSRSSKQIAQSETTPKGTRPFQRKRNSDSPLLCKPFKRKSENIEHIGQFAAELQALSEKVRIIKENDSEDCIKEEPTTNNEEKVKPSVVDNKENSAVEANIVDKRSSSYDDLFDDSIDDSMARCTQEIEEMLNLTAVERGSTVHSHVDIKKEKSSSINNTANQVSVIQSKESSATTSTKNLFHGNANSDSILRINVDNTVKVNSNSTLKTYSKLSLKKDANSSVLVSPCKDKDLHKRCFNNNMVQCDTGKSCDDKKPPKDSIAELFDFADDSFDDCLATCIEDDKLLSATIRSGGFLVPSESSYKNLTHAPLKGNLSSNSAAPKVETSTTNTPDNRKFFKFKSLSDQYLGQNAIVNYKNTARATLPSHSAKPASYLSSTSKNSTMLGRNRSDTRTSVSTDSASANNRRRTEDSAISQVPSANRAVESDINRPVVKESGNRFVKYNSTGNMRNDIAKESAKIGSLPTRCSAEQIEMKRLQAKMRLEAKRKLYALNIKNNINR